MTYLHTKFHKPGLSVSLVIVNEMGVKNGFDTDAMLLLYVVKHVALAKVVYSSRSCHHITFQDFVALCYYSFPINSRSLNSVLPMVQT